jgi:hypothetical protein
MNQRKPVQSIVGVMSRWNGVRRREGLTHALGGIG